MGIEACLPLLTRTNIIKYLELSIGMCQSSLANELSEVVMKIGSASESNNVQKSRSLNILRNT